MELRDADWCFVVNNSDCMPWSVCGLDPRGPDAWIVDAVVDLSCLPSMFGVIGGRKNMEQVLCC